MPIGYFLAYCLGLSLKITHINEEEPIFSLQLEEISLHIVGVDPHSSIHVSFLMNQWKQYLE